MYIPSTSNGGTVVYNSTQDLARFFSENSIRLVSINEFMKFWTSLSNGERDYYRTVPLG